MQETLDDKPIVNGATIDWGAVQPGIPASKLYKVANTGNVPLTVSIDTTEIPSGWTLEWEITNHEIAVGGSIEGWLILTVPVGVTSWPTQGWGFWLDAV